MQKSIQLNNKNQFSFMLKSIQLNAKIQLITTNTNYISLDMPHGLFWPG